MTPFQMLPPMTELLGLAGFALYVINYTLLTLRHISGDSLLYFVINISAASLVLIGLSNSFDLASALIQSFWIAMSLLGIMMRVKRRGLGRTDLA